MLCQRTAHGFGLRTFALLVVILTWMSLVSLVTAQAVPVAPAGLADEISASLDSSLAKAQRIGKPVEVADTLTETSSVMANPNGTFTMRSNAKPVRVKKNGSWRDIDTSLTARPDGTLAPVASPLDLAFSGGGNAPLVTLAEGDKKVSLAWPSALPKPVVTGNSATYASVFPGVDLQVTADVTSYSEVLVVHDATAARNPALASIKFTATSTGLALDTAADGTLSAKDTAGKIVFTSSTPMMWDSSHDTGSVPTATNPGDGRMSAMKVSATKSPAGKAGATSTVDVAVTPDPAKLVGPDVRYPLYLDPSMSRTSEAWAEVATNGWHYFNHAMDAQVGRCDWNRCGTPVWVARSFFQIPTPDLMSRNGVRAQVFQASFFAIQTHGTSCTAEATDLHLTGPINADTRWEGPAGTFVSRAASAAGDQCGGARWVQFDAGSAARYAADNNNAYLTFGLRSPDENNKYQWKTFANNPHLDVVFSFPPNVATGLNVSNGVRCSGEIVTPDAYPTLYATSSDNNAPPLNLGMWYEVWDGYITNLKARTMNAVEIASGSQSGWSTNVNLGNGVYAYRVAVQNLFPGDPGGNLWAGPWSSWVWFIARSEPITQTPSIASNDYTQNYWGRPQGTFSFNANGAENIVGFAYTFTGSGTEAVPTTTDCNYNQTFGTNGGWVATSNGAASLTVPAGLTPGHHTLHVRSFDDAHKLSPESQAYTFYIAPTLGPVAPTVRTEAESLNFDYSGSSPATIVTRASTDPGISGGKYVSFGSGAANNSFGAYFNAPAEGDYDVTATMVAGPAQYGDVTFLLDNMPAGGVFHGSTPQTPNPHPIEHRLTGTHLTAGNHRLEFKIVSRSPDVDFQTALDHIQLAPAAKIDVETMPILRQDNQFGPQANCCGVTWNNGQHAMFVGSAVEQSISLRLIAPIEADYALNTVITKAPDYGTYTLSIDEIPIARTDATPIDGYNPTVTTAPLLLGGVHLTAGQHALTIKLVGTNPNSTGARYLVGIDYLTAIPINNVTTASFTDAMNNKGISVDNTAAASFDLNGTSLSAQTLAAAGLPPGSAVKVNGANFTLPTANTSTGNDNVIAAGQTIPFPAGHQIKANAVGLLVASTCGAAPPITGTVTYTDGTTSNPLFPSVMDWATGPADTPVVVLPYRNVGTVREVQILPKIYAIFPPTDPTKTLKSMTLPNYATSFLPMCPQNALHVFAMAPRPVAAGWIGAWTAPADDVIPVTGFSNATVRSVVHPNAAGPNVRIRLSNRDSLPVTIGATTIAAHTGTAAATAGTPTTLKFGGSASATIPAGGEVYSDPVPASTGGDGNFVVSLHLPGSVTRAPLRASATAPTYLATGNATSDSTGTPYTTTLPGTYYLTGVDMSTSDLSKGTVVVLGDRASAIGASDGNHATWVDGLPPKLDTSGHPVPGGLVNASLAGIPASGAWKLNDGTGSTARDTASNNNATQTGGVTWNTDHGGSATFNGSTGMFTTPAPVLNTTTSYTVSAWVKLNSTNNFYTAVSQGGPNSASFYLQYSVSFNSWTFVSPNDNTTAPAGYSAAHASTPPAINSWTHLTGVFDAATKTMRLYVNGQLAGTASSLTPWNAPGSLAIGGVKHTDGNMSNFFNGSISDVRVHQSAATDDDVRTAYYGNPGPPPGLGALTATHAPDLVQRTAANAPNVRTVIVSLGAADILAGHTAGTIEQDLSALLKAGNANGLKGLLRSDGTRIHLILTTVPPLGLDAGDQREKNRRELNADILTNFNTYGADNMVDFDQAVRDTTDPGKIAAGYLTGGAPNTAYHDKLAQTLADAITKFPPDAQL